jgi:hypothetical protein
MAPARSSLAMIRGRAPGDAPGIGVAFVRDREGTPTPGDRQLSDVEAEAALRRIDALRGDPLVRFLDAAPVEDEPITPEEEAAVAEADADRDAGEPSISFDEIRRKYA